MRTRVRKLKTERRRWTENERRKLVELATTGGDVYSYCLKIGKNYKHALKSLRDDLREQVQKSGGNSYLTKHPASGMHETAMCDCGREYRRRIGGPRRQCKWCEEDGKMYEPSKPDKPRRPVDEPTMAVRGTAAKIEVLRQRVAAGMELWHPGDAREMAEARCA
jgi:hypothetical protein